MTKKFNKGSKNQNAAAAEPEFANEFASGDSSKANKRNKNQKNKTK